MQYELKNVLQNLCCEAYLKTKVSLSALLIKYGKFVLLFYSTQL